MDLDSGADSVSSTPRSIHHKTAEDKALVRLMCSFGGKILPRPHDNQLRYVGGDTRIVAVHRSTSFSSLLSKLSILLPSTTSAGGFTVKYQLPNEDLDALISVSTDEDVENMIDEFDRLSVQNSTKIPRLRLFLFPSDGDEDSRTSSIASLLDGSRKRENWFLDALNGGNGGGGLERGRSEASSIVSEVPDYLFGLDNSDDPPRLKNRTFFPDQVAGSDPSSPAVVGQGSSPFGSTSSAPPMPNLPPVKTKLENPVEDATEPAVRYTLGHAGAPVWNPNLNPGSPYPGQNMQAIPVYYVPACRSPVPAQMQTLPVPVSVPVPGSGPGHGHFIQQYGGPGQVQVPVGYPGSGQVGGARVVRTVSAMEPYEMQLQGNVVPATGGAGQPVYYRVRNAAPVVGAYPGMVDAEDVAGARPGPNKVRSPPA